VIHIFFDGENDGKMVTVAEFKMSFPANRGSASEGEHRDKSIEKKELLAALKWLGCSWLLRM